MNGDQLRLRIRYVETALFVDYYHSVVVLCIVQLAHGIIEDVWSFDKNNIARLNVLPELSVGNYFVLF